MSVSKESLMNALRIFKTEIQNEMLTTIIEAIQSAGSSAATTEPTTKITPTLTVGTTNFDLRTEPNTTTITYNGDGNLYLFDFTDTAQATISGATLTVANANGTFKVGATEGTNYAAATPVTVTVRGADPISDPGKE